MSPRADHPAANDAILHHPHARDSWLAFTREQVLDPALPIIDPHHHLWQRPSSAYMLAELVRDMRDGHRVLATVFAECTSHFDGGDAPESLRAVGETRFVSAVAAEALATYGEPGVCAGIIGFVDLRDEAHVDAALAAHVAAAAGRFRGIRQSATWDASPAVRVIARTPPPHLLADAAFRRGFARLAPLGLSFDAWLLHTQIGDVCDLAAQFPETRIVMDHIGGPIGIGPYAGARDEVFAAWRHAIRALAAHPNVVIKFGGLGMSLAGLGFDTRATPAPSAELAAAWRPWFDVVIDAFGARRCMFESNFPVDQISCSYRTLWNAFKHLAAGCSQAEKSRLFSETAAETYRLDIAGLI